MVYQPEGQSLIKEPSDQGMPAKSKNPGQSIDQRLFVRMLECVGSTKLRTNRTAEVAQFWGDHHPGKLGGENTLIACRATYGLSVLAFSASAVTTATPLDSHPDPLRPWPTPSMTKSEVCHTSCNMICNLRRGVRVPVENFVCKT